MSTLTLKSEAFADGEDIPAEYTCDGENINPPLTIDGVPDEALSLALIVEDPDVPKEVREDQMFDHWVVWNIPPSTEEIEAGAELQAVQGANSSGEIGYTGMCPPPQHEPAEHAYHFKLFALDATLDLDRGDSKSDVQAAMEGHVIAEAQLVGLYKRKA